MPLSYTKHATQRVQLFARKFARLKMINSNEHATYFFLARPKSRAHVDLNLRMKYKRKSAMYFAIAAASARKLCELTTFDQNYVWRRQDSVECNMANIPRRHSDHS